MRLVITFLLSLFFLLVRGNDHLFTNSFYSVVSGGSTKLSPKKEKSDFILADNSQTQIRTSALSNTENDGIDATEIEDDEFIAYRKYVEITNYFLTLFYNQLAGNLNQHPKDRLPFCKHFSYSSSSKYIVHRVIRI